MSLSTCKQTGTVGLWVKVCGTTFFFKLHQRKTLPLILQRRNISSVINGGSWWCNQPYLNMVK